MAQNILRWHWTLDAKSWHAELFDIKTLFLALVRFVSCHGRLLTLTKRTILPKTADSGFLFLFFLGDGIDSCFLPCRTRVMLSLSQLQS